MRFALQRVKGCGFHALWLVNVRSLVTVALDRSYNSGCKHVLGWGDPCMVSSRLILGDDYKGHEINLHNNWAHVPAYRQQLETKGAL